jgi:hypothetical protein
MKQLFRNNYITITLVKGLLLGVAYDEEQFMVVVGPLALELHTYMFKRKRRYIKDTFKSTNTPGKPQSF